MHDSRVLTSALIGVLLLLGLVLIPLAASAGDEEEPGVERSVTLDQVPAAVKETILGEAGVHKVREIEEITFPDSVIYEAEWIIDGKEFEVTVAPDGTLLESGTEDEDGENDDEGDDDEDREQES